MVRAAGVTVTVVRLDFQARDSRVLTRKVKQNEDIAARPYYVFQKMENVIGGKLKLKKPLEGAIK